MAGLTPLLPGTCPWTRTYGEEEGGGGWSMVGRGGGGQGEGNWFGGWVRGGV
jgi:hypothetical protein